MARSKQQQNNSNDRRIPPDDSPLTKILEAEDKKNERLQLARKNLVDPRKYINGAKRFPSNPFRNDPQKIDKNTKAATPPIETPVSPASY